MVNIKTLAVIMVVVLMATIINGQAPPTDCCCSAGAPYNADYCNAESYEPAVYLCTPPIRNGCTLYGYVFGTAYSYGDTTCPDNGCAALCADPLHASDSDHANCVNCCVYCCGNKCA